MLCIYYFLIKRKELLGQPNTKEKVAGERKQVFSRYENVIVY